MGDNPGVYRGQASSVTAAAAVSESLGLTSTINGCEDPAEQDALLAGALAAHNLTAGERVGFAQAAGREQDDTLLYQATLSAAENAAYNNAFNGYDGGAPKAYQPTRQLIQQAVEGGYPLSYLAGQGLTAAKLQMLNQLIHAADFQGRLATADALLAASQQLLH